MAINASLQHLGFVIRQLTKGKTKDQIDFDQHVLTAAMKDSLGGNAKTLMIVNISPSDYNIVQTRESLEFAKLTGKIVNQPGLLIADTESKNRRGAIKAGFPVKISSQFEGLGVDRIGLNYTDSDG